MATIKMKPLKPHRTELVFVVDCSGSMYGLEKDTVGGINATLDENRKLDGEVNLTITLFNQKRNVIRDGVPLSECPNLTMDDYQTSGCTALLDAVGETIENTSYLQNHMPAEYKADKVIFVITTDGLENASTHYTYLDIKKMIETKTEEGWEFLFLGSDLEVVQQAAQIGIASDRVAEYVADVAGTQAMHASVSSAVCGMRMSSNRYEGDWKKSINADKKSRKHGKN